MSIDRLVIKQNSNYKQCQEQPISLTLYPGSYTLLYSKLSVIEVCFRLAGVMKKIEQRDSPGVKI